MGLVAASRRKSGSRRSTPKARETDAVQNDDVLTVDDLVVYLKLPKSTVYKLAQEGTIPGQKVGRHWRFHRRVIDRWLGEHG